MYTVTNSGVLKTVEAWSVMLPLHDNDGREFTGEVVDSVLSEILLSYPGFSVANTLGYWKGSDQTFIDRNYQVSIDAVPDTGADSSSFFAKLKAQLQKRLQQEKIYITRQDARQELLSFEEFFAEVGVEVSTDDVASEAAALAKRLAANMDFMLQRMGYETLLLRVSDKQDTIRWERRICGIKITSELKNVYPAGFRVIAADQFAQLGKALVSEEPFVLIGTYEYLTHVLKRQPQPLVEPRGLAWETFPVPYSASPDGEPLNAKQFIEAFTASVLTNCLILREEGFLAREITINVGSDGSMQHASSAERSLLMHCPASIPDKDIQVEIVRCLGEALERLESNDAGGIALMQAKARNNYVLKRSMIRQVGS